MDNQKFNLILDRLLEKTEQEKLDWETTADRDTFLVLLKDSSISVNHTFGYNPDFRDIVTGGTYIFDFRNENGDIVESVEVPKHTEDNEAIKNYEKAEKIFELARRQSFKSDKTVDRILEQLAA